MRVCVRTAELDRRDQVTATNSWPGLPRGAEVDNQVAATAEARTPNWHRARIAQKKSADGRKAIEAARLNTSKTPRRKEGRKEERKKRKNKNHLTLSGLLTEELAGITQWACPRGDVEAEITRFFSNWENRRARITMIVFYAASAPKVACIFPHRRARFRTGSLCLVLDKLDGVAGVVADERERSARVVVEFKDYFHTLGLQ
jgi:hypothetical protein